MWEKKGGEQSLSYNGGQSNSQKYMMRWVIYSLTALVALAVIGLATLASISILIWPKLPALDLLTDYRPRVPLRVYTADGYLIKEIGEERREVVKIENVPTTLKQALLAAEDEGFYEHMGIEPSGMARAVWVALKTGRASQGASTITQQVARNFFLTRDRTAIRKLYEILLALKIEHNLSKDQILELYINQIYLGQRAYGFEVAAQTYFGKPLTEITLGEAAMLAGLPQAPAAANPITNPVRALKRQKYVLSRMVKAKFITEEQSTEAQAEPIKTTSGTAVRELVVPPVHAEYVAEIARQIAVEQFGEKATQIGIKVITTITRAEQEAAYEALRKGVMEYDLRHGYRGPEKYLSLPDDDANVDQAITAAEDDDDDHPRDYGDLLIAVVLKVTPKEVTVYRNGQTIRIGSTGLGFAGPMLSEKAPQGRRVRRGAVVRIRNNGDKGWELTQMPEVEAALVSLDSHNGSVRALVGGFDFGRSQFNNVTQARRQPGSSFKPFIYSASLERAYAPGTLIADEPLYYPEGITGRNAWEPHNYDNKFDGMMTVREALTRSKNIPAIRVLEDITPAYAQNYIVRFGFDTARHPPYLTMALGAGLATPWEMATGYAVFSNGGYRINPYVVKAILDINDKPLASVDPPVAGDSAPLVIDRRNAWIMDSMLRDVVNAPRGTGGRARALGRKDLAGKTGTTNDYVDAWFCGYNPQIVAVAWFGFPTPRNLGKGETGGSAPIGIWVNYMRTALANVPETFLPRPPGIASALADDGGHEDYYYEENRPPEMRAVNVEENGLDPIPFPFAPGQDQVPPAPYPGPNPNQVPPAPYPGPNPNPSQVPPAPYPGPNQVPPAPVVPSPNQTPSAPSAPFPPPPVGLAPVEERVPGE
jgi:penicillin-binding protein 1A